MEGWESEVLSEVIHLVNGGTPSTTNEAYWSGEIPWLSVDDFNTGNRFVYNAAKRISELGLKNSATKILDKGDIIISARGTVGVIAQIAFTMAFNQSCYGIKQKKANLSNDFIYYFLHYYFRTIGVIKAGSTFDTITKKTFDEISISFPINLEEQAKLISILSTLDESIEKTEQLIAKYKNIKQGLMHDLLAFGIDKNGIIRNPLTHKFVEKNGMMVSEDWDVKTLREICKIFGRIGFRGYTQADLVGEGYGAITLSPSNIKDGMLSFNDCTYISFFKYEESPEIKIFDGDILFVKTGSTFGKIAQVKNLPEKATINPQFIVLKEIQCDKVLLTYIMQSYEFQNRVKLIVGGSTIPTLSQEKLYELNIRLPKDPQEQTKISEILEAQDKLIESEQANLFKLQNLKQGLMQDLLTGKVRVKI